LKKQLEPEASDAGAEEQLHNCSQQQQGGLQERAQIFEIDIFIEQRACTIFDQALFRELEDKSQNAFNNPSGIIEFTVELLIRNCELWKKRV
jgi:hypothetical protein